jgi:predicted nucleotidyltransferase
MWPRTRLISMAAIRRLAREIAEKFDPEKIILFGSYAYGEPNLESDVDLLVVMPAYNEINQEIRIANAVDPPFSLDLLVRTPERLRWRLEAGDWFLREVVGRGRVLYEKTHSRVGAQGRSRLPGRPKGRPRKTSAE